MTSIARLGFYLAHAITVFLLCSGTGRASESPGPLKISVSFSQAVHAQPITGRLLVMFSHKNEPEVRFQTGWIETPPVFGVDVHQLQPGKSGVVDDRVPGFPLRKLEELPPGDYYVQAFMNVYTQFRRSDGHVIWAHNDQWEGQDFMRSPGNLYSAVHKLHIDPKHGGTITLTLDGVIPPLPPAIDTKWVKHIKIQSKLLTQFWGRPIYLGAVVLLPRDYDANSQARYPVIYRQGHFKESPPFGFSTEDIPETENDREFRVPNGFETGYQFYQAWNADDFPRVIAVAFQHPTPYFDNSDAVNSANEGPYGDAIMTELIPYLEEHFRMIRQPFARALAGGSAGGWEALALQLYHPEFFGGAWIFNPDSVDFRRWELMNVYEEENAFLVDPRTIPSGIRSEWWPLERSLERDPDGQPIATVRDAVALEDVLGSHSRGAGYFAGSDPPYNPVGGDGYPRPLFNHKTGKIDRSVVLYMRDHGYDLREYAASHWTAIGPQLIGKLHFYCGDMDNWYSNLSVYLFDDFLRASANPHYPGSFEYGRPMKQHGWQPMTNAELVRIIAAEVSRHAPNR
jgi:hypothetical protein